MPNKPSSLLCVILAVGLVSAAGSFLAGCDQSGSKSATEKSATPAGNSVRSKETLPHDGASAEGPLLQGVLLVAEAQKALANGDMATAKAKLEELEKIKSQLSELNKKDLDDIRLQIQSQTQSPTQSQTQAPTTAPAKP